MIRNAIHGIEADWSLIPAHCREGLARYLNDGIPPGSFVAAVLCNDLRKAYSQADEINFQAIPDYVWFLHNYADEQAWGSPERVSAWIAQGGSNGLERAQSAA